MRESDYIASGILQDYCLGLLTDEEKKKVEAMCHVYPEVARELNLLRSALEKYATSKIEHNTELRRAVWESIKKLSEENP
jgi:anti-sigma-K factor RskA